MTNADDFLNNGTKLKLKECGPYVYSERWEKVGIEWHPNGTLSYRQKKLFFFEPTLSMGAENDTFLLPNVPMLVSYKILNIDVFFNLIIQKSDCI